MPDAATLPLHERLMESIIAWCSTPIDAGVDPAGVFEAARQVLVANTVLKRRDEDTPITPESEEAKKLRLIVAVSDEGRQAPYAPIRKLHVRLVIRGNVKLIPGKVDGFNATAGALETLLEGLNLQLAWTSSDLKIAVMLARRSPGNGRSTQGDIRKEVYMADVRAVGLEHTS